jgi:hypothetical protein
MRALKMTIMISLAYIHLGSIALAAPRLVALDSENWESLKDAVQVIETHGGRIRIACVPHFIMADIPDGATADLLKTPFISAIHEGVLDPADFTGYGPSSRHIITAWNNVFMGKAKEAGLDRPPNPDRRPLINDVIEPDESTLLFKPPGAKVYDTSEFMLGSVVLGVILAESDGSIDPNSEDWTQTQEDNVTSEIIAGLNWYVTKAGWRPLSFYTVFNYAVPTS